MFQQNHNKFIEGQTEVERETETKRDRQRGGGHGEGRWRTEKWGRGGGEEGERDSGPCHS